MIEINLADHPKSFYQTIEFPSNFRIPMKDEIFLLPEGRGTFEVLGVSWDLVTGEIDMWGTFYERT